MISNKVENWLKSFSLKEKLFFPRLFSLSILIFLIMGIFTLTHLLYEQISTKNDYAYFSYFKSLASYWNILVDFHVLKLHQTIGLTDPIEMDNLTGAIEWIDLNI